ncbi:hypothetical protein L599_001800000440, partial [Luteimonas sp. J16]
MARLATRQFASEVPARAPDGAPHRQPTIRSRVPLLPAGLRSELKEAASA